LLVAGCWLRQQMQTHSWLSSLGLVTAVRTSIVAR
jgi:hypothetical protein